jgi:hypothetical protein
MRRQRKTLAPHPPGEVHGSGWVSCGLCGRRRPLYRLARLPDIAPYPLEHYTVSRHHGVVERACLRALRTGRYTIPDGAVDPRDRERS